MGDRSLAFVLMPFEEEFDPVYESFMKPSLEDGGFDVDRADDIESQRNILRDVLEQIERSDLIVADLTSGNPNVFYELGLAHAFRKPVVLVTQSIEEVPFDLRQYRLLEYNTHFAEIDKAREKLTDYAKRFLEGELRFGSPVTDFSQGVAGPSHTADSIPNQQADEDDRGFIDHLIDITDGYGRLAKVIEGVTSAQLEVTESTETATAELTRISANPSTSSPAAVRRVSRRLAERIGNFNSKLKRANDEYAGIAQNIENSLESVVSFQLGQSDLADPTVDEQLSSMRYLLCSSINARNAYLDLASTMGQLPRIERRLNRAVTQAIEEISVMASNLDKTIASISRALKKHD